MFKDNGTRNQFRCCHWNGPLPPPPAPRWLLQAREEELCGGGGTVRERGRWSLNEKSEVFLTFLIHGIGMTELGAPLRVWYTLCLNPSPFYRNILHIIVYVPRKLFVWYISWPVRFLCFYLYGLSAGVLHHREILTWRKIQDQMPPYFRSVSVYFLLL